MRYRLMVLGIVITAATVLSAQPTYRLQENGELFVSRNEWCSGQACIKWHLLDNNPNTREITAGLQAGSGSVPLEPYPDAPPLYQRHADGKIWFYTGKPCCAGSCPGWRLLDDHPADPAVSIVAAGEHLYQRRRSGAILRWTWNDTCRPDGSPCPAGWQQLQDANSDTAKMTVEIAAAGIPDLKGKGASAQTELYKRHKNGEIWRYKGQPCSDLSCWELLQHANPDTRELTATVRKSSAGTLIPALYQRRSNSTNGSGSIWSYNNTPCRPDGTCPGWKQIDNHAGTMSIVTAQYYVYQLRNDGPDRTIWIYDFHPCLPDGTCPGWKQIDKNPRTVQIAAGSRSLYKRHDNGTIWRYPVETELCEGGVCPPWQLLYDPTVSTIVSSQN